MSEPVRSIMVVGGGTAGWSAAALLSNVLGPTCKITLIESSDIPTVGVGEATIPPIFEFLQNCGIDEVDFIRRCQATFKLAIRFDDWLHRGHRYWHPFGTFGMTINQRPFHHYWWKNKAQGHAETLADFCPSIALAEACKFVFPSPDGSFPGGGVAFALHFDAGLVAQYLRAHAEKAGVQRLDRRIKGATVSADGLITSVVCDDGEELQADLYIDCSGFRGLLIEESLKAGYDDWSHWLPCDRAVAVPSAPLPGRTPYTIAGAQEAGWRWRIPLQNRVGNGYVWSSKFTDEAAATATLLSVLDASPLAEPRHLRFTAGHRKAMWIGNCVAVGLSSGFLEPLESNSIHLIHTALNRLIDYFPRRDFEPSLAQAYNREAAAEYAHIRDFILLHYVPNQRVGEPFWDYMRGLELPLSLAEKIDLFQASGRIVSRRRELFADISWFFVAHGMGIDAAQYDPLIDAAPFADVRGIIGQMREVMQRYQAAARSHDDILALMLDPRETRRPNFGFRRGEIGR
ncbi:tryptophan halogenase family protein [Novosphingobium sp. Chol11]|uniref:tryptophan halogenase family protein n=1 Tax=Novosphingobium sp. Chol11 TaxID=1385763 RepID=UPI0025F831E2|nr:tryptophan halogenase family protein [Novosphingobium sp. Chol11]